MGEKDDNNVTLSEADNAIIPIKRAEVMLKAILPDGKPLTMNLNAVNAKLKASFPNSFESQYLRFPLSHGLYIAIAKNNAENSFFCSIKAGNVGDCTKNDLKRVNLAILRLFRALKRSKSTRNSIIQDIATGQTAEVPEWQVFLMVKGYRNRKKNETVKVKHTIFRQLTGESKIDQKNASDASDCSTTANTGKRNTNATQQ